MSGASEECQVPDDQMVPSPINGVVNTFLQFSEILIFNLLKTRQRWNFSNCKISFYEQAEVKNMEKICSSIWNHLWKQQTRIWE